MHIKELEKGGGIIHRARGVLLCAVYIIVMDVTLISFIITPIDRHIYKGITCCLLQLAIVELTIIIATFRYF